MISYKYKKKSHKKSAYLLKRADFFGFYQIVLVDYLIIVISAGRFLAGARASGVQALAAKAEVSLPSFSGLILFPLESPPGITIY